MRRGWRLRSGLLGCRKLRPRRIDDLVAAGAQPAEIAPAVMVQRIHGLRVGVEAEFHDRTRHERHDTAARHRLRCRDAQQVEHGRHHVHRANRVRHFSAAHQVVRRADHERHVGDAVVDEEPVLAFPVVAEALAVVAHDDDDRPVVDAHRLQLLHDAANLAVDEGHLAVVRPPLVTGRIRLGRTIRRMRIVEVKPREERRALRLLDPRQRFVRDLVRRPLNRANRQTPGFAKVEIVEVGIEALVHSPLRIEHVRGDEAAGSVTSRLQHLGEGDLRVVQEEASIVADAVLRRESAGKDARMNW